MIPRPMYPLACAMLLVLPAATGAVPPAPDQRPPNIVLLLADDLGYGEVGFNGQRIHRTPQIDRLAAEGLRFSRHYAGSAVCAPSRCVLLTGRHAGQAQIRDNLALDAQGREFRPTLAAETVTVARRLQAAGYATACIGKWGLGDEGTSGVPWRQGFDHFHGFLHNTHGTRYYTEFIYRNADKIALPGNYGRWRKQYAPDLLLDEALRFIEQHRDRPFFLYFPTNLVHGQYIAPPPDPELPEPPPPPGVEFSERERAYLAMVRRLDRDVGRIVRMIDALGLGGDTLILFTSDNGNRGLEDRNDALFGASGGLRGGKADLYEGGIRVPFVARWTGTIAPGLSSDRVSGFVDFLATACELAGVPVGTTTDGVSFAAVLRGGAAPARGPMYWELAKRDEPWVVPRQAVMEGDWKLVRNGDAPPELYRLGDDPAEAHDLASRHPDLVARLSAFFSTLRTDHPEYPLRAGPGVD